MLKPDPLSPSKALIATRCLFVGLILAAAPCGPALGQAVSEDLGDSKAAAAQMLADVTLIDRVCTGRWANFGLAFRSIEQQGVDVWALMPGGADRPAYDAATNRRLQSTGTDELCGALATRYAAAMPGLFGN